MLFVFLALLILGSSCERGAEERLSPVQVKELIGIKGCPYCHDMRRELLGPSFKDISARYGPEDKDELVRSLLEGSAGKWGDKAMPPQKLTREEAELIVEWILNRKYDLE